MAGSYTTASLNAKLNGKRILFIGAKFYYYNEEIISKMTRYGATVTFFYERNVSLAYGLAKTFAPGRAAVMQDRHYEDILKQVEGQHFDYLLVIRGWKMEKRFVDKLKSELPDLKTILYQWDSRFNWECEFAHMIPWFDITKTFDYLDSEQLGIAYVPTFHIDEFKRTSDEKPEYDLFFFGGYSHTRYEFVQRLVDYTEKNNIKLRVHLAITLMYFLRERLAGRKLSLKLLSLQTLSKKQYISAFYKANIILDYTNPNQTGITMRTLDAFGAGKKILTSNAYIRNEPGYSPEQVRLFDPAEIAIDKDFLEYRAFPHQDYSIDRWLNSIFD